MKQAMSSPAVGRFRRGFLRSAAGCIPVLLMICLCVFAATGPSQASNETARFEDALREVAALVESADFQAAIARAEQARPLGRKVPRGPQTLESRARLEVLLSSAQVALGDRDGARSSMKRALYLWPLLSLDPRTTSPRVLKVLHEARRKDAPAKGAGTGGTR